VRADLSNILADIDTLDGERAFKKKFEFAWASLGFDTYTYFSVGADEMETGKVKDYADNVIYMSNLPPLWVQHYVEEGYVDTDPVARECLAARLPIRWNETYRSNVNSAEGARMLEDAWENGLRRGLTIPIHGPRGELGIFSLNSQLPDKEFERLANTTQFEAQVLAYHFHDAVRRTMKPQHEIVPPPMPLTEREVEILRWTAAGKTAWEIGGILNISERTVNFHVQNVMEKFGVHNKTHAAAKALGMGLFAL
jgi:DNA-binding CsgD family transcriptional regulator